MRTWSVAWAVAWAVGLGAVSAGAQTPPVPTGTPPAAVAGTPPTTPAGETPGELPLPPDLASDLAPQPGGLTADQAAARALRESAQLRAARANTRAADAARSEAGRALIPNVTLTARYTRLSEITPPQINFGGSSALTGVINNLCVGSGGALLVGLSAPSGTVCPMGATPASSLTMGMAPPSGNSGFTFPVILDQYTLQGTLTVPLTDLPFRLARVYEGAGYTVEARRLDEEAARLQVASEARVAFYEHVRARGQARVAAQGLQSARRNREDIARFVEAGTLPRVDLLRVEARVAEAERTLILAQNGVVLTEAVLRLRMHAPANEPFALGESLEEPVTLPTNLDDMIHRAWHDRPEIASLSRQLRALEANLSAARAGQYPSLVGVFNTTVASPNARFIPQTTDFNTTWDASLQLTWSPTQAYAGAATVSRVEAQREALVANVAALREGLELEVRSTFTAAQGAHAAIEASARQLEAAEESYRVSRQRFLAGSGVSRDLTDAETSLVSARLALVNAHVELRIALARLRRALGQRERP
ncbi:MAG: TolC family protein [Deltaproteobacteria bacterium]|nr:TolC family protein [Deltaproteobacteria bacterium]